MASRRIAGAGLLLLAIAVAIGAILSAQAARGNLTVAAPTTADNPQSSRAATFAIEAAAETGLLNPTGDLLEYVGYDETADGWTVRFNRLQCYVTDSLETCDQEGNSAWIAVSQESNDFVIVDASPSIDARQQLVGRRRSISAAVEGWVFPVSYTGGLGGHYVEAVGVWAGPIGPGAGSKCTAQLIRDGIVVWESVEMHIPAPARESKRSGTIHQIPFPEALKDTGLSPRITCTSWSGRGWEIEAASMTIARGDSHVGARFQVTWDDEVFENALTRCIVSFHDASGSVVGEEITWMDSPRDTATGPPYRDTIDVVTFASKPNDVVSADAICSLVSPEQLGQE